MSRRVGETRGVRGVSGREAGAPVGTVPATPTGPTVSFAIHIRRGDRGRRRLRRGARPAPPSLAPGRVPRVARLLALAIRYDRLIREGEIRDYAELARLGGVSRARVSQLMDLMNLAPEIQEEILFLPRVTRGRDPVTERSLRSVTCEPDWNAQHDRWRTLPSRPGR